MKKIENLRQRLIIGSNIPLQIDTCPSDWQFLLKSQPTEEVPTLALALLSHYQMLTEQPIPPANLSPKPLLPQLAVPPLPKKYHYLLKQALTKKEHFISLLSLLASRGYSLPAPFWQKVKQEDIPNIPSFYTPWIEYLEGRKEVVTVENWANLSPAARYKSLEKLRRNDSEAFRTVVSQCFMREKASERTKIASLFQVNLSAADLPFLQSCQNDRSKAVKEWIEYFLAQLDPNKAQEVVARVKKGMLMVKSESTIKFKKPVGYQERNSFLHNLDTVNIALLAASFHLNVAEFADQIQFKVFTAFELDAFIQNIGLALPQEDLLWFIKKYLNDCRHTGYQATTLAKLLSYLSEQEKEKTMITLLTEDSGVLNFYLLLSLLQRPLGKKSLTFSALKKMKAWYKLKNNQNLWGILALGFFLPHAVAKEALAELEKAARLWQLSAEDDWFFSALRLNAALPEKY